MDPESGTLPHLALAGDDSGAAWSVLDWSPDDSKLLVLKEVSISEGYLYIVDLSSGQKREVEPGPTKVGIGGAKFSRDGQGIYLISDRESEFARLRYVGLFTNEKTVISAHIPWDIEALAISRDGHYLAYVSNEAGIGKLNLLDLRTHQDLTPPRLPQSGVISSLSFDADGHAARVRFRGPEPTARRLRIGYRGKSSGALDAQRTGRRRCREICAAAAHASFRPSIGWTARPARCRCMSTSPPRPDPIPC